VTARTIIEEGMNDTVPAPGPDRAAAGCAVARSAIGVIGQCESLLSGLSDGAYSAPSRVLPGGTVGRHVRHALDHFVALLSGYECRRTVEYDRRERGVPMETDRGAALIALARMRDRLGLVRQPDMDAPVRVRVMLDASGADAELTSTLGRELAFAAHHAVHHHAMIKAIAAEHGHEASEAFGTAPSTLNHATRR